MFYLVSPNNWELPSSEYSEGDYCEGSNYVVFSKHSKMFSTSQLAESYVRNKEEEIFECIFLGKKPSEDVQFWFKYIHNPEMNNYIFGNYYANKELQVLIRKKTKMAWTKGLKAMFGTKTSKNPFSFTSADIEDFRPHIKPNAFEIIELPELEM